MGEVDLDFKPLVPVFDANVALGRRHDKRVVIDTIEGLFEAMDNSGVDRAVVYSPHAEHFDIYEGNRELAELTRTHPNLIPQFVANPATEDISEFVTEINKYGVSSVRLSPKEHRYPLTEWVVGEWIDWIESVNMPIWIPVDFADPTELFDLALNRPALNIVLAEVHYIHVPWVMPLLSRLSNVSIEISRFVIGDGITRLVNLIGQDRIIFGSRFPESSMGQQIYNLHHNNLNLAELSAICSGNVERLLGRED